MRRLTPLAIAFLGLLYTAGCPQPEQYIYEMAWSSGALEFGATHNGFQSDSSQAVLDHPCVEMFLPDGLNSIVNS